MSGGSGGTGGGTSDEGNGGSNGGSNGGGSGRSSHGSDSNGGELRYQSNSPFQKRESTDIDSIENLNISTQMLMNEKLPNQV